MDSSLLVSLSHQLAAYRSLDVIANNIANAATPGFRREEQTFHEYVEQLPLQEGQSVPQTLSFVQDGGVVRDMTEGALRKTGSPFDLAIHGNGFFVVQTANGLAYTRNGHFTLDNQGQLVDDSGNALQGDGGAVSIGVDDGDIHVGTDGTVSGRKGQIGKLRVVDFADDTQLVKNGASLYSTTQQPNSAQSAEIRQGVLEESNVQPVVEISRMVELMRSYQATATMTQSQEDLMRQAIDKLGQMPSS